MISAAALYGGLFEKLLYIGLATGAVALLFAPLIRRGMHGVK
jgi:proton-dependent oligopeptide transporter, POT family